ncbi:hypothetical protein MUU72_00435 [Streptomyces sp. RS10V-4]|nr:hypothetical protein [Streptomyces rhizoryzae]MCK7621618.1 hypothetical protein [Streptomyces rhizoryzae]
MIGHGEGGADLAERVVSDIRAWDASPALGSPQQGVVAVARLALRQDEVACPLPESVESLAQAAVVAPDEGSYRSTASSGRRGHTGRKRGRQVVTAGQRHRDDLGLPRRFQLLVAGADDLNDRRLGNPMIRSSSLRSVTPTRIRPP